MVEQRRRGRQTVCEVESDTEGYCCISSLSSCLTSENRLRPAMSGLFLFNISLSARSYCFISLFYLSHPRLVCPALPLHSFSSFSSVLLAIPRSFLLLLRCLLVFSCSSQMSSSSDQSWKTRPAFS